MASVEVAGRLDVRGDPRPDLGAVVAHLRGGGVAAYPTETVYGFGSTLAPEGVNAVRALKRRADEKPFIVLLPDRAAAARLRWTPASEELAKIFWPGALTLVLADPERAFPDGVRNVRGGVAVRVSPHPVVASLLGALREPITSTSVNVPGGEPARSGADLDAVLGEVGGAGVFVIDAGTLPESGPSTIIDCSGSEPVVLREGTVPLERLRCAIPEIDGQR